MKSNLCHFKYAVISNAYLVIFLGKYKYQVEFGGSE